MHGSYDAGKGAYRISMQGNFDFEGHQDFRKFVKEALAEKAKVLVIDFAQVEYIDSSALGMLMLAKNEMESIGGSVALESVHGYVNKVLSMVKFDTLFNVTTSSGAE